jgi:hypothetical protein
MIILGVIGISGLLIILLLIAILIFGIIGLVDVLKSKFESNNKLIWVIVLLLSSLAPLFTFLNSLQNTRQEGSGRPLLIVVILLSLLGIILYQIIGKKQKIK